MLKKPLFAALSLFLFFALAGSALAQPPKGDRDGRDGPPPKLSLTDAQKATWDKLFSDYKERLYPLTSQLKDQKLLYDVLADQTNVNLDEVKRVIAEMRRLRDQIRAESKKFQADLKSSGLPEILGVHARGLGDDGKGRSFKRGHRGGGPRDHGGPGDRGPRGRGGPRGHDRDYDDDDRR
jgi:Spy/CpxP family protein refolding chaperone